VQPDPKGNKAGLETEESEDTVAVVEASDAEVNEASEDKVIEVEANADWRLVVLTDSVLNCADKDERAMAAAEVVEARSA